ncbi:hypothetical protein B0T11DRAFT_11583 [Plectosphaerella cucumerina]|uniref:Secreted protein n=1 Tax=Plectosphaerella cucumerina TaxID=40658 RepID=A0A8K0TSI5_9PEZI|nr:hypothetical protein B0T11DRAFT_11583 [Plectosphaerella cucumerina]
MVRKASCSLACLLSNALGVHSSDGGTHRPADGQRWARKSAPPRLWFRNMIGPSTFLFSSRRPSAWHWSCRSARSSRPTQYAPRRRPQGPRGRQGKSFANILKLAGKNYVLLTGTHQFR